MKNSCYNTAYISQHLQVGNNCILHMGAVVGSDGFGFAFEGGRFHKLPQMGIVVIEDDVEIGDAIEMKEIPFVVGVLADLSGKPDHPLPKMKDRKFIEIDRDNFDSVMKRMKPGLNLRVENTLKGDGTEMGVQLKFESMDDFDPVNILKDVFF